MARVYTNIPRGCLAGLLWLLWGFTAVLVMLLSLVLGACVRRVLSNLGGIWGRL